MRLKSRRASHLPKRRIDGPQLKQVLSMGQADKVAINGLVDTAVQSPKLAIQHGQASRRQLLDLKGAITHALVNGDEPGIRPHKQVDVREESGDVKQLVATSMLPDSDHARLTLELSRATKWRRLE
jgi:hypothetical protein